MAATAYTAPTSTLAEEHVQKAVNTTTAQTNATAVKSNATVAHLAPMTVLKTAGAMAVGAALALGGKAAVNAFAPNCEPVAQAGLSSTSDENIAAEAKRQIKRLEDEAETAALIARGRHKLVQTALDRALHPEERVTAARMSIELMPPSFIDEKMTAFRWNEFDPRVIVDGPEEMDTDSIDDYYFKPISRNSTKNS